MVLHPAVANVYCLFNKIFFLVYSVGRLISFESNNIEYVYARQFIVLSFFCRISEVEPKYYADGEDAYAMRRDLTEKGDRKVILATKIHVSLISRNTSWSKPIE